MVLQDRLADRASRGPADRQNFDGLVKLLLVLAAFFAGWGRLRLGEINLTVSDVFTIICLAVLIYQRQLASRPFGKMTEFWLVAVVVLLAGLFISSIFAGATWRWLNIASQYSFSLIALPCLIMSQQRSLAKRLCLYYAIGVSISNLIGIVGSSILSYPEAMNLLGKGFLTGNGRVGAMASDANPNGASIAFAAPMMIYAMRKQLVRMSIALPCLLALGWGLLLTASFTGFVATTLSVAVTMLFMGMKSALRMALFAAIAVFAFYFSGVPMPASFEKRVGNAVESGDIEAAGTFENRSQLIREAWGLSGDHIFIGMGVDKYRTITAYGNPVHNLYLLIWNEGGFIAFVAIVTIVLLLYYFALMNMRWKPHEAGMALAITLVFTIYTMSYPHMYSRIWFFPVTICLATTLGHGERRMRQPEVTLARLLA